MSTSPTFVQWQRSRGLHTAARRTQTIYTAAALRQLARTVTVSVAPAFVRLGEACQVLGRQLAEVEWRSGS